MARIHNEPLLSLPFDKYILLGGVILAREPLAGEGVLVVADPGAALQWQNAGCAVSWGHLTLTMSDFL